MYWISIFRLEHLLFISNLHDNLMWFYFNDKFMTVNWFEFRYDIMVQVTENHRFTFPFERNWGNNRFVDLDPNNCKLSCAALTQMKSPWGDKILPVKNAFRYEVMYTPIRPNWTTMTFVDFFQNVRSRLRISKYF